MKNVFAKVAASVRATVTLFSALVLVFLVASCVIWVNPVSASSPNSWASKAPMQEARFGLGVAVVNGKIYAIGGSSLASNDGIVGTNEEYDPATDTWSFKAPMPTPRQFFSIAVYNNKIYCIGGEVIYKDHSKPLHTNVNEVYDPATDTWETKAPMPTPRIGSRANVVNGKIYLMGGSYPNADLESEASTHNEVYDPVNDSWTAKAPMLATASNTASAVWGDEIYFSDQIYNTKNDSWSYGSPLNQSYGINAVGVTSGIMAPKRIYVFGKINKGGIRDGFMARIMVQDGLLDASQIGEELYYYVQFFDPESDSWTAGTDIPTGRSSFAVAVLNDTFYVIGGITYAAHTPSYKIHATNEQYTPFGYGTVPPTLHVVSPENKNYASSNISLAFTLNKPVTHMGYSLDGQDNVTITGNTTLSGLTSGLHNVTVYATDETGNLGSSETITFTITETEPEPFPTTLIAGSIVTTVFVSLSLIVFLRKHKNS